MNQFVNPFTQHIVQQVAEAITKLYPTYQVNAQTLANGITEPPNRELGHYAFPCFPLAKELKLAPPVIANKLAELIKPDQLVQSINAAGPYLNLSFFPQAYGKLGLANILNESWFQIPLVEKKRLMFEYSQPNTHKELHVGHMRNLCLGNALVRMNRYLGHEVMATTYPGDVGTHVAKCLWYLKFHNQGAIPTDDNEKGPWLGALYTKATLKLDQELGTEKEADNRLILTTILKQLEAHQGEYYDLWKETRQWSIDLMNKVYHWADVQFDRWYFESEVDAPSLQFARDLLAKGKLVESEGAIGMDLNEEKLGFCMLIKSDGTGLYATKDIALAHKKFEEYHLDQSFYLVDKRQAFHFQQVFKVLEKIGFSHAKDCHHLQYDFVELPDGAMSSRKGNIVPLTDLIDQMEGMIVREYLEKYRGDWSDDEIEQTASIIANGAIKYGMIRMDIGRKIVFDMKEWLKLDGETGPYLQYVCARIHSLCDKQHYDPTTPIQWEMLTHPAEVALMQKLVQFNDTIRVATIGHKTAAICSHLYETGKLFNSFYAECSVAKAENNGLKAGRLGLSKACELVMTQGLAILGIKAPSRM